MTNGRAQHETVNLERPARVLEAVVRVMPEASSELKARAAASCYERMSPILERDATPPPGPSPEAQV